MILLHLDIHLFDFFVNGIRSFTNTVNSPMPGITESEHQSNTDYLKYLRDIKKQQNQGGLQRSQIAHGKYSNIWFIINQGSIRLSPVYQAGTAGISAKIGLFKLRIPISGVPFFSII